MQCQRDALALKQRKEPNVSCYKVNKDGGVAFAVEHLANQGVTRNTSHKIRKNFQERNTTERIAEHSRRLIG